METTASLETHFWSPWSPEVTSWYTYVIRAPAGTYQQDPTDVLLAYLFPSFIFFLFSLSSLIREEFSKFRGTPGNHEIHGNPGISTTPGVTLRLALEGTSLIRLDRENKKNINEGNK